MNTSKAAPSSSEPTKECCMCGDLGLFSQLFRCKSCRFRYQHRYCSNQYPKADQVYHACNWCLNEKENSGLKTQNSMNSSSSNKTITSDIIEDVWSNKKINSSSGHGSLKNIDNKKQALRIQINQAAIVKKGLPERSPALAARKRITTVKGGGGGGGGGGDDDVMQEKLRRTKSEDISNRGIIRRQIFRNKVKRYKLLDEVSC